MNRQEVIQLAESLGILYPNDNPSLDYSSPAHQRLISKLEKFAQECYDKGVEFGWDDAKSAYGVKQVCGCCGGSGRVVRDVDIGTDQECFVCNGTGKQTLDN